MGFSDQVREDALVACGRCCCICHTFCGLKIELHHIVLQSEGGEDTPENCIPLCFNCHADMSSYDKKHPKGSKYTPGELRRRRQDLYEKLKHGFVDARRVQADVALRDERMRLKRSIIESCTQLRDLAADFFEKRIDGTEQIPINRVKSLWMTIKLDFEVVKKYWNPKRNNTNDEKMADYDRQVQNYTGRTGNLGNLASISEWIREEAAGWPLEAE